VSDVVATTSSPAALSATEPPARILVVDDVEANRESLARRLARRGYAVELATGGRDALDRLAIDPPLDLVLLDIMMPDISGFEVLAEIRKTRSPAELPIVMATANDKSEDVVKAMGLGANDYVTKPLDFPVVLARVQTQLSLKRNVAQIRVLELELGERNVALERLNESLRAAAEKTLRDLELGARVQASMLPKESPSVEGLNFAWAFRPCEQLAGDALDICPLGRGVVGAYVLDVVGHGVASSLLSVAAMRAIGDGRSMDSMLVRADGTPTPPAEVAERLNRAFPFNAETGQFFTFFYAIIDSIAGALRYVSAGHPGAILLSAAGGEPRLLNKNCTPIGIGGVYEDHVVPFAVGDRVYFYSDGIDEAPRLSDGDRFGASRLIAALVARRSEPLQASLDALLGDLDVWREGRASHDDVTLLAIERK
jgi:phosphoserine phosphatase RsbU/P